MAVSRYAVPGGDASEYEPGSNGEVLRNLLGITNPDEMGTVEWERFEAMAQASLADLERNRSLDVLYIRDLHRLWLGAIYPFAGELRTVNVSKGYVTFCPAANVGAELDRLDKDVLAQRTPCDGFSQGELAVALAIVHVEFIIIHPFREGNGRIGRWLASLMALQAGHAVLDFEAEMEGSGRERYFQCLRKGFAGDYDPAIELFAEILKRSS